MDVASLRAFVHVSDSGSISRSASALGYSQPGLSLQIQALERRLGCRLLHRDRQGSRLTQQGAAVLPYARVILQVAHTLTEEVRRS